MAESKLLLGLSVLLFVISGTTAYSFNISRYPSFQIQIVSGSGENRSSPPDPIKDCKYRQDLLNHSAARFQWILYQRDFHWRIKEEARKLREAEVAKFRYLKLLSGFGKRVVSGARQWIQPDALELHGRKREEALSKGFSRRMPEKFRRI